MKEVTIELRPGPADADYADIWSKSSLSRRNSRYKDRAAGLWKKQHAGQCGWSQVRQGQSGRA